MKALRPSLKYPFTSKRDIVSRLDDPKGNADFVREAVEILHRRFVDRDVLPGPAGWMASHRKLGEELYVRLAAADCTEADLVRAAAIAARYAKQIAMVLRQDSLARDPRLGLAAAVFGVRPEPEPDDMGDPYVEIEDDVPSSPAQDAPKVIEDRVAPPPRIVAPAESRAVPEAKPHASPTASPKKRGRPLGSKNKVAPKDAPKAPRRRR